MQQNARVLFCLYGTWLDHRFPKQDQWQTFDTLRSLTSWWHEGTQIYLPEVLVLVWFVCFMNFVSSITTLQLEVCKSTSIISVDDESPKVSNSNSTALSALQTLHPIPAAGSRAGGAMQPWSRVDRWPMMWLHVCVFKSSVFLHTQLFNYTF